jgi:glyoxylase-like metal-dependent hydrolase (beta-lactamase superfamily II)
MDGGQTPAEAPRDRRAATSEASTAAAARIERPASGGAVEVAPGVVWIRLPLPGSLEHVNVWLLADGDGWALVDTGHGDRATQAVWDGLARTALRGRPVRRVIATHHHADHIGLAAWMAKRWHAELWTTRAEWLSARASSLRPLRETRVVTRDHYRRAGGPADEIEPLVECSRSYPDGVAVPPTYRRLHAGEELQVGGVRWRVLVGAGHAPEHACLFAPERGLFLSGDQVLPGVTPTVAVSPSAPDDDPLAEFLVGLERLRGAVPDDALVLPAHGRPFAGLRWRCDELALHHRARLEAALIACAEPVTAWDVMGVLFARTPDPHQTSAAIGEALAHLNHLVVEGRIRRDRRAHAPDRYCVVEGALGARRADAAPGASRAAVREVPRER